MTARIVFDLDGTLIDSVPHIHNAACDGLAALGFGEITLDQARGFVGRGLPDFIHRTRAALEIPEEHQARLEAEVLRFYEGAAHLNTPYPGVVYALEALAAEGHKLGICTNKPISATRAVIEHLDMARFFPVVLGGDSLPVRKPDPAPLLAALEALGDGQAIYVGDSEVDAETADRADVPFLLFTEGYRKTPADELPHDARFDGFVALRALVADLLEDG